MLYCPLYFHQVQLCPLWYYESLAMGIELVGVLILSGIFARFFFNTTQSCKMV